MKKNSPIGILLVVAVVAIAIYFLVPSFIYYSKPADQRDVYLREHPKMIKKILNLGLDLQGGMRLVLEIDRSKLDSKEDKDVLDRAYTIIENRVNALGVAEPVLQKQGKDRIIVELPGLKNEAAAREVIGRTAQLEFNLLREPMQLGHAIQVIDEVVSGKKVTSPTDSSTTDSTKVKNEENQQMAEQMFSGNQTDSTADTSKTAKVEKQIPFKDMLVSLGDQIAVKTDNVEQVNKIFARTDVRNALERAGLGSNVFLWGHDTTRIESSIYRTLFYVKASPEMRGDVIKDARASLDQGGMRVGGAQVDIEMNAKGARKFSSVTAANTDKFLAIVLDSTVYSAPRIIQKIPFGKAQITGSFTMEEAKNLAIVLRAGALPAPVNIIEERVVGPSLGQDSIHNSMFAGLIGAVIVIVFMCFYYRMSGFIAIVALAINILALLAIMAGIHSVLTLPGIAGIILLIGMNVDANVIIYERIREELKLGKTVKSAIDSGYENALRCIIDSNLTTILTALILLWKGTGAFRGFAVTLIFGISVSLFTALFVSKLFMNIIFQKNKNTLSI